MTKIAIPRRFLAVTLLALVPVLAGAQSRPLTEIGTLSAGAPELMNTALGPLSYVEVPTQKLANAKVLWVNWDYLASKGFDVGSRQVTPALEKAIIDAFGYGVPGKDEPKEAFTNEKKMFYADRYGGDGLGVNLGSGRAASAGSIQIKGVGRTRLVRMAGDSHSNGTVGLGEAIREAIYGEVGQKLPFGANRVIAILDRGTTTLVPDGNHQLNTLVIREDPLRSAHYVQNLYGNGPLMESEPARVQENLKFLLKAFPVPPELARATKAEQTRGAILAYAERVAAAYATAYALKIYHGATSISNIEVSGRFIDYGTMTTLPDYGKVRMIPSNDPNGEIKEFKEILMLEFLRGLRAELTGEVAARLPTDAELTAHFEDHYKRHLHREFLALTGLSREGVYRLEGQAKARKLTDLLLALATKDSLELQSPQVRTPTTELNVNRILVALSAVAGAGLKALDAALKPELKDAGLRRQLVTAYADVLKDARPAELAGLQGRAVALNAEHPEAFNWEVAKGNDVIVEQYRATKDRSVVANRVDTIVKKYNETSVPVRTCRGLFAAGR